MTSQEYVIPSYSGDLFSDDALADSYPTFRQLRDLGGVVWLERHGLFAVTRHAELVEALRNDRQLVSGQGVSVNERLNGPDAPTGTSTLTSDGATHRKLKQLEMRPLRPAQMVQLRDRVMQLADRRVSELANGTSFDAMAQLAGYLPTTIVADLVGIKGVGPDQMLAWSGAVFDAFGPAEHARTGAALPTIGEFVTFASTMTRADLVPGGWADRVLEAAENGELPEAAARDLIFDYVLPSLDTTIYATGELLFQLATNPDAFARLKREPELIGSAILETVRLACPLRGFTRLAVEDVELGEVPIAAGSRLWLLYASGNRDERRYPDPDRFDVARNPRDHLGWGHGVHLCSGMHLARLEMESILTALLQRVDRIECGEPVRIVNNSAQGYASLPLTLHPA